MALTTEELDHRLQRYRRTMGGWPREEELPLYLRRSPTEVAAALDELIAAGGWVRRNGLIVTTRAAEPVMPEPEPPVRQTSRQTLPPRPRQTPTHTYRTREEVRPMPTGKPYAWPPDLDIVASVIEYREKHPKSAIAMLATHMHVDISGLRKHLKLVAARLGVDYRKLMLGNVNLVNLVALQEIQDRAARVATAVAPEEAGQGVGTPEQTPAVERPTDAPEGIPVNQTAAGSSLTDENIEKLGRIAQALADHGMPLRLESVEVRDERFLGMIRGITDEPLLPPLAIVEDRTLEQRFADGDLRCGDCDFLVKGDVYEEMGSCSKLGMYRKANDTPYNIPPECCFVQRGPMEPETGWAQEAGRLTEEQLLQVFDEEEHPRLSIPHGVTPDLAANASQVEPADLQAAMVTLERVVSEQVAPTFATHVTLILIDESADRPAQVRPVHEHVTQAPECVGDRWAEPIRVNGFRDYRIWTAVGFVMLDNQRIFVMMPLGAAVVRVETKERGAA